MTTDPLRIAQILVTARTIAVVGLSRVAARPSNRVAQYMQQQGYRIVPINPRYAGELVLGQRCYATLADAAAALAQQGVQIEMVDCFRNAADIPPLADAAIAIGAKCLWLQRDIVHEAAAAKAQAAGLTVVMDRCLMVDHALWLQASA